MATKTKKEENGGVVGRLAGKGEEALTRLMDELGRNERVTEALSRAANAKGKLDVTSRAALQGIGLAPVDDVRDLQKRLESLEKRLAKIEDATGITPTTKRAETKKPRSSATRKKRASPASKKADQAAATAPGGALGGGARGGTAA
ncbi:hypothetical protein BH18ACT14_BH18ACT14_04920 [soil metagenome]